MPLGHFTTKYGEDIGAVMLEEINKRIAASQASPGFHDTAMYVPQVTCCNTWHKPLLHMLLGECCTAASHRQRRGQCCEPAAVALSRPLSQWRAPPASARAIPLSPCCRPRLRQQKRSVCFWG